MVKLLIILVIILSAIAIGQLARVHELNSLLRGRREENIPEKANRLNGRLFFAFMIALYLFFLWQVVEYGDELLHIPASKHGIKLDNVLYFNYVIIILIFLITNTFLFYFAYRYYGKDNGSAYYYPENNKLEMIWTIVPAIFLAIIIIYGLVAWDNIIMDKPKKDSIKVELYGKQFDWTARYPGEDGKLGKTNFNLVSPQNPLGIITKENIKSQLESINKEIDEAKAKLEEKRQMLPENKINELEETIKSKKRQRVRIHRLKNSDKEFKNGYDDKLVKGEFHLPVDKQVSFQIRSRDVIHSAYMPHFRAQMNAVPGIKTKFKYTPIITTEEMKKKKNDPEFEYMLICNKICGTAHYNMKMKIVVEEKKKYNNWLNKQKPFSEKLGLNKGNSKKETELAKK
ncbi:MAG: cytochrome c oxidase subunit II [Flavobacteriales bacterium]